jgi:hypothetical protein
MCCIAWARAGIDWHLGFPLVGKAGSQHIKFGLPLVQFHPLLGQILHGLGEGSFPRVELGLSIPFGAFGYLLLTSGYL